MMYGYNAVAVPKNVVIYARVSTEHEAQLSALENQLDWYKPLLEQHPEWTLVRSYVDEGITGTSAKKRPQFMQMLSDAKNGDFNLILTREVSRFARNTVDTLQYTRDLKRLGVEVFFINDNIRTFDGDGELRLTIMATLAQDESRKTSIRVKSGQQTSMENGVYYGNGNILGYNRVGKELVIDPEQAKTVRKIYDWYLDGMGVRQIQFELEKEGVLTAMGKTRWYESNISKILKNPFYAGILEYHKQFTPDFLEQKKINNFGEIDRLRVDGRHEPIVTLEEFNRVQEIMESKRLKNPANKTGRKEKGKKPVSDVWCRLLICSCGCTFNRKVWHTTSKGTQYGYMCYSQIRNGTIRTRLKKGLPTDGICTSQMISGWKLQFMAKNLFREFLRNTDRILDIAEEMLEKHIDDEEVVEDNTELIAQKKAELDKLEKRLNKLISMRADDEITKEQFMNMKSEVDAQIASLQEQICELSPTEKVTETSDVPDYNERITLLRYALERYTNFDSDEDIPEAVIEAFVEKIVVNENSFDWYLHFSGDDKTSKTCNVDGNKKAHKIELFGASYAPALVEGCSGCNRRMQEIDNRLLTTISDSEFKRAFRFKINLDHARDFLYAYSKKHRVRPNTWNDLNVSVYL